MTTEPTAAPGLRRVAILGLGVMGGSLARALARLEEAPERVGWSPDPTEPARALADGALTRAASGPADASRGADAVILAAPVSACVALVPEVLDALGPGAVLTDVASLKEPIAEAVARAGGEARWVGSHPMCGSAGSGYAEARADLYDGAHVYVVPGRAPRALIDRVRALWSSLGTEVIETSAAEHDALMSLVSHLPQLTANALALALEDAAVRASALGPGGSDMTRLASSSPEMWRDILTLGEAAALAQGLRATAARLADLAGLVERRDVDTLASLMARTRNWKEDRSR